MADINWGLVNTKFGEQLGAALDQNAYTERNNKLADLAQERQIRNMQLADSVQARAERIKQDRLKQSALEEYTGGQTVTETPQNVQDAIGVMQGMPQDAATQQTIDALRAQSVSRGRNPEEEAIALARLGAVNPQAAAVPNAIFEQHQRLRAAEVARQAALDEKLRAEGVSIQNRKDMQAEREAAADRMARLTAGLRPAPQEQLVAITGKDGNAVLVPRSQAAGNQPFNSKTAQSESAKQQATISAQQVLDQAAMIYQHPGRSLGTGVTSFMSNVPGTDARGFKANLDTFKAQTFIPMVSALKGMGALSDAEGKKLSDSVGALDPAMPSDEFAKSLQNVTKLLYEKAKANGLNVSLPNFAGDSSPVSGGTVNSALGAAHPQDNEAVQWARSNPKDPRSAAIIKANGG